MRVLELRAIDLYHRAGVPKQDFRGRFHNARLSRPGRTQKKQVPHRTAGRVQSSSTNLEHVDERRHALFLTDDLVTQASMKIKSVIIPFGWVQLISVRRFYFSSPATRLPL